jgi:dienelactone hydrolase
MRTIAVILLAAAAGVAGCGESTHDDAANPPFAYDASAPLHFVDRGRVNHDYPIAVDDVSYSLPDGHRVDGLLIVPPGRGPFPAVVYLHGSGGDRTQLLLPATWLASRSVVTLTISSPVPELDRNAPATERLRQLKEGAVAAVIAAERAVDALQALPSVDGDRIGIVGWSAGARTGALVAGLDRRIRAFDLYSGGATPLVAYVQQAPKSLAPVIERELGAVDPLRMIRDAPAGSVLLQDGRHDEVVPRSALEALAAAAGAAAEVRWYDQGHEPSPKAYRDGMNWLAARLGVAGPVVKGAVAGP